MTYFAVDSDQQLIEAVNYAIANLGGSGLIADVQTGVISAPGDPNPVGYLYQYLNVRYANNATGTDGFSSSPSNRAYYGLRNSTASAGSNNPADYIWSEVSGGFGTTKFLFYSAIGGRQIVFTVATSSPGAGYAQVQDGVAIDLDDPTVIGATGPAGATGPQGASGPSGPTGPAGDRYATTSTTSLTIATGPQTLTVDTGLSWTPSQSVLIAHDASNEMTGTVTSYATGNGVMVANITSTLGSGTYSSWDVNITGAIGVPGATGPTGPGGAAGATGPTGPSQRGPIALAFVISNATPIGASTATLNSWFSAPRTNVVAPIGVGETPISGDTAQFYYPVTNVGTVLNYNGTAWQNVTGNVIDGNLIVSGTIAANQIAANAVTAGKIQASAVTTDKLDANSVTAAKIQANAVTATQIAANAVTSDKIIANAITAAKIAASTITGDKIAAATITGNLIAANTIAANSIEAGSITATQISSDYVYTGNLVSFNATLGNTDSAGYWLRYSDGDARFGGNVSIGANLAVSGLISASSLVANTVNTTQVIDGAISDFVDFQSDVEFNVANAAALVNNSFYDETFGNLAITTTQANQSVFLWFQQQFVYEYSGNGSFGTTNSVTLSAEIVRSEPGVGITKIAEFTRTQNLNANLAGQSTSIVCLPVPGIVDVVPSPGNYEYKWRMATNNTTTPRNITFTSYDVYPSTSTTNTLVPITLLGLVLKR